MNFRWCSWGAGEEFFFFKQNKKQAWAELCQAQDKLGLAKIEIFFYLIEMFESKLYLFKTKYENLFRSAKFRKSLFENCQLRETFPFQNGHMTREDYVKFRNETGWR